MTGETQTTNRTTDWGDVRTRLRGLGQQFYLLSHPDTSSDRTTIELAQRLESEGFERVEMGGGRWVFKLPTEIVEQLNIDKTTDECVVKFALYSGVDGIDGRDQNRCEMQLSESAPSPLDGYILRTVAGDERGFWVVQPYVEIVEEESHEFHGAVGDVMGAGYGSDFSQMDNWGRVNGQLCLIDFGYLDSE